MIIGIHFNNYDEVNNILDLLSGFKYSFDLYTTDKPVIIYVNTDDKLAYHTILGEHHCDAMLTYRFFMREYWRFLSDKDEYYMQDLNLLDNIQNDITYIKQQIDILSNIPKDIKIGDSGIVINYNKK